MPQNYIDDATLLILAPEFAPLDSTFRQTWIEFTKQFVDLNAWGECSEAAHFFVTAHFLETLPSGGLGGPGTGGETGALVSEANGPASRSFSSPATISDESGWASSGYGRKYLLLRAKIIAAYKVLPTRRGYNRGMSALPRRYGRGQLY